MPGAVAERTLEIAGCESVRRADEEEAEPRQIAFHSQPEGLRRVADIDVVEQAAAGELRALQPRPRPHPCVALLGRDEVAGPERDARAAIKPRRDGLLAKTSFGTPVSAAASATLKASMTFEANCTSSDQTLE